MGSKVNWDKEEQKLSEIMFELSKMVCLIWFRFPKVSSFSLIEASKSTRNSSFRSACLQVLMAFDAMLMSV